MPFNFVGIEMPNPYWDSQNKDAATFGTITFDSTTSKYKVQATLYRLDGFVLDTLNLEGDCQDGVILIDVGQQEPLRVSFTPSGTFFTDNPSSRTGMVGFKSDDNVSIQEVFGKSFVGMRHQSKVEYPNGISFPETQPFKATIDQNGESLSVDLFTDIAKGSIVFFTNLPISSGTQIHPGMFKGTIIHDNATHNAIWIVRKINGKYLIISITDNGRDRGFNLFMIEK